MTIAVSVKSSDGTIKAHSHNDDEAVLVFEGEYMEGDYIAIDADSVCAGRIFAIVQLDHCMEPCFCYIKNGKALFTIPFNEKRISYAPFCFSGTRHYIHVRCASQYEILCRKNLAFNPYDTHENTNLFPHSKANVETRGESVFASRNAIDGYLASSFHGEWPYTSWGINKDPHAELSVDFGRPVIADEIVLYLRTDFPHDAWWNKAVIEFSDSTEMVLILEKKSGAQKFAFAEKLITSLVLKNLIKADDPSPFPALTQIQVFGSDTL